MTAIWQWKSPGARATQRLGEWLGKVARPGLVLALSGDLGAGKTCLVQGLARGLGVPRDVPVVSPTFGLLNTYPGRFPLHHLDFYRLGELEELEALGLRDLFDGEAVTVMEWADRFVEALPTDRLELKLGWVSARTRRIEARACGEGEAARLLKDLQALDMSLFSRAPASPRE